MTSIERVREINARGEALERVKKFRQELYSGVEEAIKKHRKVDEGLLQDVKRKIRAKFAKISPDDLIVELLEMDVFYKQMKTEIEGMKEEIKEKERILKDIEKKLDRKSMEEEKYQKLLEEIKSLNSGISERKEELSQLKSQIKSVEAEMRRYEDMKKRFGDAIKVEDAKRELIKLEEQMKEKYKQRKNMQADIERLKTLIEEKKDEKRRLEESYSVLRKKIGKLEGNYTDISNKRDNILSEIDRLLHTKQKLMEDMERDASRQQEMKFKNKELLYKKERLEREIDGYKDKINEIKATVKEFEDRKRELELIAAQLTTEKEKLEKQKEDLEKEKNETKEMAKKINEKIRERTKKIKEFEQNIETLKKESQQIQKDLEKNKKELKDKKKELKDIRWKAWLKSINNYIENIKWPIESKAPIFDIISVVREMDNEDKRLTNRVTSMYSSLVLYRTMEIQSNNRQGPFLISLYSDIISWEMFCILFDPQIKFGTEERIEAIEEILNLAETVIVRLSSDGYRHILEKTPSFTLTYEEVLGNAAGIIKSKLLEEDVDISQTKNAYGRARECMMNAQSQFIKHLIQPIIGTLSLGENLSEMQRKVVIAFSEAVCEILKSTSIYNKMEVN